MKILPALATPVHNDAEALQLLEKDGWYAQQKLDGVRLLVHIEDGKPFGINRKGDVTLIHPDIEKAFQFFTGTWVFDGEVVGATYWVFDLLVALDHITPEHPLSFRREVLEQLWPRLNLPATVQLVPNETTTVQKLELAKRLRQRNAEGLILKKADAPYQQGKRSRDQLKWKFTETIDCFILETWREGKESIAVGVIDQDTSEIVNIGSVKMTAINLGDAERGDVVEIRYLYAQDPSAPRLYQPVFVRKRDDKAMKECLLNQLKFTSKEVIL